MSIKTVEALEPTSTGPRLYCLDLLRHDFRITFLERRSSGLIIVMFSNITKHF